jgi:hypothetical protein
MPKRLKKRPSTDPNEWAHQIVRASTEEAPTDFQAQLSDYMSKLGKKGGKVSGARRMKNLSAAQRATIASKAAKARWKKEKAAEAKKP